ncbi:MAG: glycosyl hydrolase family 18 protein [Clostridia bacterium]
MKTPILATYGTNNSLAEITDRDIKQLDILYLAFGYVRNGHFTVEDLSNIDRVSYIKSVNKDIKIIISLQSDEELEFQGVISTSEGRELLAKECKEAIIKYDLDGIDIDWEFPTSTGILSEKQDHTALLKVLRETLDTNSSKKYYLTIAAGTMQTYLNGTELGISHRYLDYVNLMTYDMNWVCKYSVHHTCAYKMDTDVTSEGSAEENIELYVKAGVPIEKILMGAAFYARKWTDVKNDERHGLLVLTEHQSDYAPNYTELQADYINKNGYIRYYDEVAQAPYLYDGSTFISYDDEQSLDVKCKMVKALGLAGIMSWQYSGDQSHELISVMAKSLKG